MTNSIRTPVDIAATVAGAGWAGWEVVHVVQAVLAENGGDAYAINLVHDEWESVDVGLFSLNTHWIPEPTLAERLDPTRAARWAHTHWDEWWQRPDVLALPDYQTRLAYIMPRMWHAVATSRYAAAEQAAVAACRKLAIIR